MDGLDGMRGLATILIIYYHLTIDFFPKGEGFLRGPPSWSVKGAYVAVDLFFVLSGYLITTVAFGDQQRSGGRLPVLRFYRRRAARILPALVLFAVGHAVYASAAGFSPGDIGASTGLVFSGLVNYPDLFGASVTDAVGHLWTLSIEIQFYLVLPLIITVLPRRRPWLAFSVLCSLALVVAVRRHLIFEPGFATVLLLTRTDSHADGVLLGVALAYVMPQVKRLPREGLAAFGWLGFGGWALIALTCGVTDPITFQLGFLLAAIFGIFLITSVVTDTGPAQIFRLRPLIAIGHVSYGLYIWHVLVFQGVRRWMGELPALVQASTALGIAIGLTLISWNLVEKPAMRYFAGRRDVTRAGAVSAPAGP